MRSQVEITWKDGKTYNGPLDSRYKYEGVGTMSWSNGTVYSGDFTGGQRDGQGKLEIKGGATFDGYFKNGAFIEGRVLSEGNIYNGKFNDGTYNGRGQLTYSNGDTYSGSFVNGMRSGKGSFTGSVELDGRFQSGKKGTYKFTYQGEFRSDKFHGQGQITNFDLWAGLDDWGCSYRGSFVKNVA